MLGLSEWRMTNEVSAEVRGRTVQGTFSVKDGWVEVIAADGRYRSAAIGDWEPHEVAQRLLQELYARPKGAITAD
jgi:hypothetical protein